MHKPSIPPILNGETEIVAITRLRNHPRNPRDGDVGKIIESIRANGFYGFVIAQRSTGYIVVGNHRFRAALHCGMENIPVLWLDISDEKALRLALVDNKTSDSASYNEPLLVELLTDLAGSPDGLEGCGFDGDDLDDLINDLARAAEKKQDKVTEAEPEKGFAVVVSCSDKKQQADVYKQILGIGLAAKKVTVNESAELSLG